MATEREATLLIFDDELTPAQGKNLELELGKRVVDRAELILDIFAVRARSAEARMQVELAQLRYRLPRLRGRTIAADGDQPEAGLFQLRREPAEALDLTVAARRAALHVDGHHRRPAE